MGIKSEIGKDNQNIVLAKNFDDYRIFLTRVQDKEFMVHNWLEVAYVLKGNIEVSDEKEIIDLKEGDLYIINPGKAHIIKEIDKDNIILILQINCEFLTKKMPETDNLLFSNRMDDITKQRIISIMGRLYINTFITDWQKDEIDSDLEELVALFVTKRPVGKKSKDPLDIDSIVIEIAKTAARDYVNLCKRDISLEDLAEEYNISYYYLSRSFKKNIGENYTDFLLKIRLNKAVDLIINTDKRITDIAIESGFSNIKSFNNAFRKAFNKSPTDFRKKYKNINKIITKSDLFLDEKVQSFINKIKMKKENTLKGKIEYNINSNNKTLINRTEWSRIVDINCLFDIFKGLDNLDRIVDNIDFDNIIINIKIEEDRIYLLNRRGDKKHLNSYEYNNIIRTFNKNNISPIIFLNYELNQLNYNSNEDFNKAVLDRIDYLSRIIGFNKLGRFVFGVRINNIQDYLRDGKEKYIVEAINNFKLLLDKKLDGTGHKWAVHFGELNDSYDLNNIKELIDNIQVPDYSMVSLKYNHEEPRYDYAVNYYINMLNDLRMHIKSFSIQNKLLTSFNYNIDNLSIKGNSKINFVNLFIIYMSLKLRSNNHILVSIRISGKDINYIDNNILDRYYFNDLGLRLPSYYIYDFIDFLGEELIYVEEGIFVTKKGANLVILIFDDYINYYNYSSKNLEDLNNFEENKSMEYKLNIKGLQGVYKKSIYKLDIGTNIYDLIAIDEKYKQSITEWEKRHLDYMFIPDIDIKFKELKEGEIFKIKDNKSLMDVHLINLEKI